jgi:hypothetical protein
VTKNNLLPFRSSVKAQSHLPGGAPNLGGWDEEDVDHSINITDKIVVQRDQAVKLLSLLVCEETKTPYVYYKRGVGLVDVSEGEGEALPPIKKGHLKALLSLAANFYRPTAKGTQEVSPPNEVIDAILDKPGGWDDIKELNRISPIPILLPDGTLIQDGYEPTTKVLVRLSPTLQDLPVLPNPTRDDAVAAVQRLLDHASGMNTSPSGRSVWLSLLLSLAGRTAIDGCVPGHGFDAAEAKAGKTTAVNLSNGLIFGEERDTEGVPKDDDEVDKRTPTWSCQPMVFWDNLDNGSDFGSANLDRLLTSTKNKTRLLGTSKSAAVDTSGTVFALTGVNLSFKGDTASRFILARLNTPLSRRYKFKPGNAYYAANQRQALTDAFTVLRAFIQAGKPQPQQVLEFNRFDGWNELIRGAILWLGLADPVGGEIEDTAEENRREALKALAKLWEKISNDAGKEFIASELGLMRMQLNSRYFDGSDEERQKIEDLEKLRNNLRGALSSILGKKIETHADAGYALKKLRDVTVDADASNYVRITVREYKKQKFYRLVAGVLPQVQTVQPAPTAPVPTPELIIAPLSSSVPSVVEEWPGSVEEDEPRTPTGPGGAPILSRR